MTPADEPRPYLRWIGPEQRDGVRDFTRGHRMPYPGPKVHLVSADCPCKPVQTHGQQGGVKFWEHNPL